MKTQTPRWRDPAARKAAPVDPRDNRSRDERLAALLRLSKPGGPRPRAS